MTPAIEWHEYDPTNTNGLYLGLIIANFIGDSCLIITSEQEILNTATSPPVKCYTTGLLQFDTFSLCQWVFFTWCLHAAVSHWVSEKVYLLHKKLTFDQACVDFLCPLEKKKSLLNQLCILSYSRTETISEPIDLIRNLYAQNTMRANTVLPACSGNWFINREATVKPASRQH